MIDSSYVVYYSVMLLVLSTCFHNDHQLYSFDVAVFFFFKQKTAYEMRISDWSSDVCSSDLDLDRRHIAGAIEIGLRLADRHEDEGGVVFRHAEIGRASCRERVCQYV